MKKAIKYIIGMILVPVIFTSCLKDKELIGPDADGAISNIVEFGNIAAPSSDKNSEIPMFVHALELKPTDLIVPIKLVGAFNPKSDIKVVIELDNSLLTKYNDDQDEDFVPLALSNYTVSSYEVVIPKGQRFANLNIKLLGDKFDFLETYALGLKIKSISDGTISGNFGNIIIATVPKNPFDGIYSVEDGNMQRYSAPGVPTGADDALNGSMKGNTDVSLASIDATTNEISGMKWAKNGGGIGGINNLRLVVDPVTNNVTMKALGNGTLTNMPGKVNKYDPATKTFTLNFFWNPNGATREITNLVLKYKGVR